MCWKVGNGVNIDIWKSNWVPGLNTKKPLTKLGEVDFSSVNRLLDCSTNQWNVQLLNALFSKDEAIEIRKISLSWRAPGDEIYWPATRSGEYSVKSAYHIAEETRESNAGGATTSAAANDNWKWIWHLELPLKVRHFVWRCCKNIIPTFTQLQGRGINVMDGCPRCGWGEETGLHALVSCVAVKNVWKQFFGTDKRWKAMFQTIGDWFMWIKSILPRDRLLAVITGAWYIWFQLVHNPNRATAMEVWVKVEELLADWSAARHDSSRNEAAAANRPTTQPVRRRNEPGEWRPPEEPFVKINTDAAWTSELNGGTGVVIRDSAGEVLLSAVVPIGITQIPKIAEMLAAEMGLRLARDGGWQNVVLESDCKLLMDALQLTGQPLGVGSMVFDDLRHEINLCKDVKVSHVKRQRNCVAHELARRARLLSEPLILIEEVPIGVDTLCLADKCNLFHI